MEDPIGKKLDTDLHEATANVPSPNKKQKGKIIDVIEKGYLLGGKVLRYAKVVVGN
jgi:molecular chaperone GrpE